MVAITAAVLRGKDVPFTFEKLELAAPRPDEVLVKISSTGLCHTDLAVVHGDMLAPRRSSSDTRAPAPSWRSVRPSGT